MPNPVNHVTINWISWIGSTGAKRIYFYLERRFPAKFPSPPAKLSFRASTLRWSQRVSRTFWLKCNHMVPQTISRDARLFGRRRRLALIRSWAHLIYWKMFNNLSNCNIHDFVGFMIHDIQLFFFDSKNFHLIKVHLLKRLTCKISIPTRSSCTAALQQANLMAFPLQRHTKR